MKNACYSQRRPRLKLPSAYVYMSKKIEPSTEYLGSVGDAQLGHAYRWTVSNWLFYSQRDFKVWAESWQAIFHFRH